MKEYCTPTPVNKLHLPDQSDGVGFQTPSETRLQDAIDSRYGKLNESPSTDRDTGFRRGIPGKD